MLEFYDFVIFAVFAVPIGKAFFPNKTPLLSIMAVFAAFAIGYLARPIGGAIFSHFGDVYGRKRSFMLTIAIMGTATLLMGILPSYHTYGIIMSIIFLILRITQGIAVGGEIPGAITFVSEHVNKKVALSCGIIFLFLNLGIFLANFIYAFLDNLLQGTIYYKNIWRFAFIIGGFLAIISYFLRTTLEESPEYLKFENSIVKAPLFCLIQLFPRNIVAGIMIVAIQATLVSLIYLYVTQYMQLTGHYTHVQISHISLMALAVFSLSGVFWGWISDFFGSRIIFSIGLCLLSICSYIYYYAMAHNQYIMIAAIIISIICGMITGNFSAILTKLFPVKVRYSGIALCYNIGFGIFGGLAPLAATYSIHTLNNNLAPAYLVIIVSMIGFIGIICSTYQNIDQNKSIRVFQHEMSLNGKRDSNVE